MPRWLAFAALLPVVVSLQACGLGDTLGLGKRAPDEFAVVRRQPLVVPPDFDLRPPRPGAERAGDGAARSAARAALTGRSAEPGVQSQSPTAEPAAPGMEPSDRTAAEGAPAMPAGELGAPLDEPATTAAGPSRGQSALLARTALPAPDPGLDAEARTSGASADEELVEQLLEWQPTDASEDAAPVVVRRDRTRLDVIEETPR